MLLKPRLTLALLTLFLLGLAFLGGTGGADGRSVAAASAPALAPECAANWQVVPSVDPLTNNYLYDVAAVGPNDVWAVGRYSDANNGALGGTLIEHWDGTAWSQVLGATGAPDHQGRLYGVAAVTANDIWAVGMYYPGTAGQTLIEHWDGTQWNIVPSPNRPGYNELLSVTAIATDDVWAVGQSLGNHATLTMHWNGGYWAIVPSPPVSFLHNFALTDVDAVATNDVWAVGLEDQGSGTSRTLIEHWDGTAWTVVPSPNPGAYISRLDSVTALAANDIWAVGMYSNDGGSTHPPLMIHWDGTAWTVVPGNVPHMYNSLTAVDAIAPDDVWAVGLSTDCDLCLTFDTLIVHWDGTLWNEVFSPNGPNQFNRPFGVAAVSANDVWMVGFSDQYAYPYYSNTLIERHTCPPSPTPTGTPPTATHTATPLPSATPTACSVSNTNYTITQSAGATVVPATTDTGIHCDECKTTISLPFPVALYGQAFNSAIVGSNGTLGFVQNSNTWRTACLPSQEFDYAILAYWQELHMSPGSCPNCGIYTALSGTAPNRVFDIEWRGMDYFYTSAVDVELRFYENAPNGQFDLIYGQVPTGGNQQVTVGVQKGQGYLYTQFVCENMTPRLSNGTRLVFVQPPCNGAPTATPGTPGTATRTATVAPPTTATRTPTATRTATVLPPTITPQATTPTGTPGTTTPTAISTVPPTCTVSFADVPPGSTFYSTIQCLACRGIVGGYPCGGPGEPCPGTYFRPNNNVTRGQVSKIVAESAALADPVPSTQQTFADVAPGSTFHLWIERLAGRSLIGGYPCGGPGEPCQGPGNRPYFRPNNPVTRGQLSKIVAGAAGWIETPTGQTFADAPPGSTFYLYIERMSARGIISGYPCGGVGEPCVAPGNKPYFRPNNNATRGQMSKIAATAFFPNCQMLARR